MTEDTAPDGASVAADEHEEQDEQEDHPKGTLLLGALFVVLLAAVWLYAYLTMIAWS